MKTGELALVHPLQLHELELDFDVRVEREERNAPLLLGAIVEGRAVGKPATEDSMQLDVDIAAVQRVSWIGPTDVRADRTADPIEVVAIAEVALLRVRVPIGSERQRRSASPSADELRRDALLLRLGVGVERALRRVLQERPERSHVLRELSEHDVGAIQTELGDLRRDRLSDAFLLVAQYELAGFDRPPVAIRQWRSHAGPVHQTSLDAGLPDPVPEPEVLLLVGKRVGL